MNDAHLAYHLYHPPVKHIYYNNYIYIYFTKNTLSCLTLVKKLYYNVVEKHFVVLKQLHKLKERGILFLQTVLEIPKDLFEMQGCLLFFFGSVLSFCKSCSSANCQ